MTRETIISVAIQALVLLCVGAGISYFSLNAIDNMTALGLTGGFGFLDQAAGFDITFSVIAYERGVSSYGRVLLVGITNTLVVSALAVILATIIGVTVGVFQLLGNWPLARICRAYIELARNVPLLLQLLFWYTGVLATLPQQRNSLSALDMVYLNVRGLFIPWPDRTAGSNAFILAMLLGIAVWIFAAVRAKRVRVQTGRSVPGHLIGFGAVLGLGAMSVAVMGTPFDWTYPVLTGFNFRGGAALPPEFVALLIGLSVYTGAFIAEQVRGGIQAVPSGQREAAVALGLSNWRVMKLVMIPQAMRIIVPPLTSQYLNVVKNSSLAVAIAYPDIVSVFTGTALNQTGRAIEIVAITMAFYFVVSLTISAVMNIYNKRVALVGR